LEQHQQRRQQQQRLVRRQLYLRLPLVQCPVHRLLVAASLCLRLAAVLQHLLLLLLLHQAVVRSAGLQLPVAVSLLLSAHPLAARPQQLQPAVLLQLLQAAACLQGCQVGSQPQLLLLPASQRLVPLPCL
jgi:hypothetical protein